MFQEAPPGLPPVQRHFMKGAPPGLPPAVARIFERFGKVEPLLAHRDLARHAGSRRLEPLLVRSPPPTLPTDDTRKNALSPRCDSVSPEPRSRRFDDSPEPRSRSVADHRTDDPFVHEPVSFRPRPPLGPKPKAGRIRMQVYSSSGNLAEKAYLAPIVPGLPHTAPPAKRRPQHRYRKVESRASRGARSPSDSSIRPLPDADTRKVANAVKKGQRGAQETRGKISPQPKHREKKQKLTKGERETAQASVCEDIIGAAISDGISGWVREEEDDGLEIVEPVDDEGFETIEPT